MCEALVCTKASPTSTNSKANNKATNVPGRHAVQSKRSPRQRINAATSNAAPAERSAMCMMGLMSAATALSVMGWKPQTKHSSSMMAEALVSIGWRWSTGHSVGL